MTITRMIPIIPRMIVTSTTRTMKKQAALVVGVSCLAASMLSAQTTSLGTGSAGSNAVSPALSQEVARARGLIERGDGAEARTVLDSLVSAAPLASLDLAEALYWRAVLAERISDAERDWKRLVIEAPLSPRTPDALLRLGELDMLRGHPADARPYFERVVREFPDSTRIARGTIWLVRSYFDERDLPRGCRTLSTLPPTQVPEGELRLQADELRRRCTSVVTSAGTGGSAANMPVPPAATSAAANTATNAAPPAVPPAAPAESTANKAPAKAAAKESGRFSVQLAAFGTRKEADASVAGLKRRGIDARVDGTSKPFRVRVGRYETRAEATAALARLKKAGQTGFVAEITP